MKTWILSVIISVSLANAASQLAPQTQPPSILSNSIILKMPYAFRDLPNDGKNYPLPSASQYVKADYANSFYLRKEEYRRFSTPVNLLDGGKDALVSSAVGIYNVVRHPIKTGQELWFAGTHPITTVKAVGHHIAENTRREGLANSFGEIGFTAGTFVAPVGVGSVTANLVKGISQAGSGAGAVGKVAQVANVAKGATTVGGLFRGVGQVIRGSQAAAAGVATSEVGNAAKVAAAAGTAVNIADDVGNAGKAAAVGVASANVVDDVANVGKAAAVGVASANAVDDVANVGKAAGPTSAVADDIGNAGKAGEAAGVAGSTSAAAGAADSLGKGAKLAEDAGKVSKASAYAGVAMDQAANVADVVGNVADAREYAGISKQYHEAELLRKHQAVAVETKWRAEQLKKVQEAERAQDSAQNF